MEISYPDTVMHIWIQLLVKTFGNECLTIGDTEPNMYEELGAWRNRMIPTVG